LATPAQSRGTRPADLIDRADHVLGSRPRARCSARLPGREDAGADHGGGPAGARCAKREMLMSNIASTHRDLWPGIDLKLENALFHFEGMGQALQPPERTAHTVVLESSETLIGGNWHRAFYAHLDAFLSAARSVPELIRCCFGVDDGARKMREWFQALDPAEQTRRREFGDRFRPHYDAFRALPVGAARHISEHRTGVPPVTLPRSRAASVSHTVAGPRSPSPPPKREKCRLNSVGCKSMFRCDRCGRTSTLTASHCLKPVVTTLSARARSLVEREH
jgi:hypothetical protein